MGLLSAGELDSVGSSRADAALRRGQEYLDLEQLERGVQRVGDDPPRKTRRILLRQAVHEDTWRRILRQLKRAALVAGEASGAKS